MGAMSSQSKVRCAAARAHSLRVRQFARAMSALRVFLLTRLVGFTASAPPVKFNARILHTCGSAFGVGGIQNRVVDRVRR